MQDLTSLAMFARVVEHGSFSAAARALGMPKSTLSRRISELERHQGVKLLHRSTRKLALTDVGRAFLVHCQTLVEAAEAADQVTQLVQEVPRGTVRVSTPYQFSQHVLVPLVPDFMSTYPEVRLEFTVTNQPVDLIEEQIDVALRARPEIEDSSLIARPLFQSNTHLYAHPELIAARGEPAHPDELKHWPTLSMAFRSGRFRFDLTGPNQERVSIQHRPILISDDMRMLREAAAHQRGLVALPFEVAQPLVRQGRLRQVLDQWRLPGGRLHLVYPHRRGLLPAVRVFVEYLVARVNDPAVLSDWE